MPAHRRPTLKLSSRTIVALVAVFCVVPGTAQRILTILHPPAYAGVYDAIQAPWMGLQTADVFVNISTAQPDSCDAAPEGASWCIPGRRTAVLSGDTDCAWETRARNALRSGCDVVIGRTLIQLGGVLGGPYQFDGSDVSAMRDMALVNVGSDDFERLEKGLTAARAAGQELTVRLKYTPEDRRANEWVRIWTSVPFRVVFWGILPLFTLVCAVETARRFSYFVRDIRAATGKAQRGRSASLVPAVVLGLELAGWACRLLQCVDLVWSTHLLPRDAHQALFSISFPFVLASSGCVVLTWLDILRKKASAEPAVVRHRVAIAVCFLVIAVMEAVFAVIRILYINIGFNAATIAAGVYFLYQLSTGAVFTVIGTRVILRLRKHARSLEQAKSKESTRSGSVVDRLRKASSRSSSVTSESGESGGGGIESIQSRRKVQLLVKMSMFLIVSSVAMFLCAISGVLIGTPIIANPYGLISVLAVTFILVNIQAFARSLIFSLPATAAATSSRSSSISLPSRSSTKV